MSETLGNTNIYGDEILQSPLLLSPEAYELYLEEKEVPTFVSVDRSIRLKAIDRCGLTCTFCHNEGTPVTVDNIGRVSTQFVNLGRSGRSSIYSMSNGVDFLSGNACADSDNGSMLEAINSIRETINTEEVHITGGEPTLHPDLPGLVEALASAGLVVKVTSNGEKFAPQAEALKRAGLTKVVFSIFGTTPEELAMVQSSRYQNEKFAERKLRALQSSILAAHEFGISAGANIVMPDESHKERIARVIEDFGDICKIRILNSLNLGESSYASIYELLAELGAKPIRTNITAGASGMSTDYVLPDGKEVGFKKIRRSHLPICDSCELKNDGCDEGYYGVRLYVDTEGTYRVGVCIQRMDLTKPLQEFLSGDLPEEINRHRVDEYNQFTKGVHL